VTDGQGRFAARVEAMRPSMVREMVAAAGSRPLLTLAGGLPPAEAFPFAALTAAAERLLASGDGSVLQYAPTEGDPRLVGLIADDVERRLGITGAVGRVLVTTGSQQALDLVAKILLDPGDVAVVECPTYVGALRAIAAYEPRIVSVPVDGEGMDTEILDGLLAGGLRPKLCYLVSNFSNPSGATLSPGRRAHLAELSRRYGFLVVEDDPYGQLRFRGDDLPAVASYPDADVLYLGSFSKTVAPGLRVGYAVAPSWLGRQLVVAKQATDLTSSSFTQQLVAELLETPGWLASHLDGLRSLYSTRAAALATSLDHHVGGRIGPFLTVPDGGMFLWATIAADGVDGASLTTACLAHDVAIVPGTEFAVGGGFDRDVRLSFSLLPPADLDEAARRIACAFDDLATSAR
jgi:2-aminoadipate transaminase